MQPSFSRHGALTGQGERQGRLTRPSVRRRAGLAQLIPLVHCGPERGGTGSGCCRRLRCPGKGPDWSATLGPFCLSIARRQLPAGLQASHPASLDSSAVLTRQPRSPRPPPSSATRLPSDSLPHSRACLSFPLQQRSLPSLAASCWLRPELCVCFPRVSLTPSSVEGSMLEN